MDSRPHIVHVYKDYWPPVLGGIERSINWMAEGLADRFRHTVLVNSRTKKSRKRMAGDIEVLEIGEWGRFQSAPISPGFPLAMRRLKADLWHFHIPNPTGDFSWLLARPRGRVVATYHSDIVRQKWAMRLYGPFLRSFLRRCDVIMPTSEAFLKHSPILKDFQEKCQIVPLGMPLDPFERTAESAARVRGIKRQAKGFPLLVFLGKLRYYKGLQYLVSAMRGVTQARLVIIGEGPEGEKLQRLAEALKVRDRIDFLGEIPDSEAVPYLQAASIFVLPSHLPSEAFGLSQVEAMACGVPVICCDLPSGVPYVNRHEETGLVVPPADDEALARAINELLNDHTRRFRMGETALRRAQAEFSQEAMCGRIETVYRRLIG